MAAFEQGQDRFRIFVYLGFGRETLAILEEQTSTPGAGKELAALRCQDRPDKKVYQAVRRTIMGPLLILVTVQTGTFGSNPRRAVGPDRERKNRPALPMVRRAEHPNLARPKGIQARARANPDVPFVILA